jgi:predicted Zn-dependent protease
MQGDIPLAINGWAVPVGKHAGTDFLSRLEQEVREGREISLKIMREDIEMTYDIVPDTVCAYRIVLSNQDIINAFADGENVVITRGMMRFTKSDNELSLVVSHELAHNVMKHISAKTQNLMLGTVLDVVAAVFGVNTRGTFGNLGAQAYSQDFEAEADYVGLYMMALTALDIESAPHFWRRMAAIHPGSIESDFMSTHPATPERFVALEKTVQEIKEKIASGEPLEPELKEPEEDE